MKQLCLLFMSLLTLAVSAGQVDELLAQFDKSPSASVANRYFALLQQQGITEEPVNIAASAPVDTLRQQVWYWAAEYYYANNMTR